MYDLIEHEVTAKNEVEETKKLLLIIYLEQRNELYITN